MKKIVVSLTQLEENDPLTVKVLSNDLYGVPSWTIDQAGTFTAHLDGAFAGVCPKYCRPMLNDDICFIVGTRDSDDAFSFNFMTAGGANFGGDISEEVVEIVVYPYAEVSANPPA